MSFALQVNSFWLFGNVYDRVDDGDKFSKKNVGLGKLRFRATKSHPYWPGEHELFLFTGNVSSISNNCDQCIL